MAETERETPAARHRDKAQDVQIVFVTDPTYLPPTLVAIWSLLRHISRPVQLHVWGNLLGRTDWENVERVVAIAPRVTLHKLDLDARLTEARGPADYISGTAMGRLFIPRLLSGKVLYIDGDTLVREDVSPLFDLPMEGNLVAAVRDYTILQWLADHSDRNLSESRKQRLDELRALMAPAPLEGYFNSGVLLFDCDAIRAEPDRMRRLEDVEAASACTLGDQDHLNRVFAGRVRYLDIAWNLSWDRAKRYRRHSCMVGVEEFGALSGPGRILHFHGAHKPWNTPRLDLWTSRGRATFVYRRQLARYRRLFPDLAARLT